MTPEEADRIWNLPKCERCDAMESRLRAALVANDSLKRGMQRVSSELEAAHEFIKLARKTWAQG